MKLIFSLLFLIAVSYTSAQQYTVPVGSIEIIANPELNRILQAKKDAFLADSTAPGFRIQIFSNSDRKMVLQEEEKFRTAYPNVPIYLKYDSPNFKLRVGDYESRLDAQYWFYRLVAEYPNLFLVPDRINPSAP